MTSERETVWLKRSVPAAALLALALAVPAAAGTTKGYKCEYDTQTCLNHMVADFKTRGWIGVELDIDEEKGLWLIRKVVSGGPAQSAGIKDGDRLVALNGVKFESEVNPFDKARSEMKPGGKLNFILARGAKEVRVQVTLAEIPPDVRAQMIGMHMMEHAQSPEAADAKP